MSHLANSRMALRIVATLTVAGLVAGCGYKGPLFMPPPGGVPQRGATIQDSPPPVLPPQTPQVPDVPQGPQAIPVL